MEDKFFTTIQDPKEFRRDLLTSSKDIISMLKDNQKLTEIRDLKKQLIQNLQRQFDELNVLMETLNSYLPEESVKQLEAMMPKKEKKSTHKRSTKKKSTKKKSTKKNTKSSSKQSPGEKEVSEPQDPEVAKLEKALANIEEKLDKV